VLAFRYNAPPFELSLPVSVQKEAAVFTTIATSAVIEQVLGRDGKLSTNAIFLLDTSRGDRLAITLPRGASALRVLLNGANVPVEDGPGPNVKIVRLAPSAGQINKVVLELRYGLAGGSADGQLVHTLLSAPTLPADIPVQQTFWRVMIPAESLMLWHDESFSIIGSGEAQVEQMAQGYPSRVQLQFPRQGRVFDFIHQGAPGELKIAVADEKTFAIFTWAVILDVGIAALKLSGLGRCVLALLAVVGGLIVNLFAPMMVDRFAHVGYPAGLIVLGLWVVHWLFKSLPRHVAKSRPAAPPTQTPPPQTATLQPVDNAAANNQDKE